MLIQIAMLGAFRIFNLFSLCFPPFLIKIYWFFSFFSLLNESPPNFHSTFFSFQIIKYHESLEWRKYDVRKLVPKRWFDLYFLFLNSIQWNFEPEFWTVILNCNSKLGTVKWNLELSPSTVIIFIKSIKNTLYLLNQFQNKIFSIELVQF